MSRRALLNTAINDRNTRTTASAASDPHGPRDAGSLERPAALRHRAFSQRPRTRKTAAASCARAIVTIVATHSSALA